LRQISGNAWRAAGPPPRDDNEKWKGAEKPGERKLAENLERITGIILARYRWGKGLARESVNERQDLSMTR
jgi:hypothetical protein